MLMFQVAGLPSPKRNPIYSSPTHHLGVAINDSSCNNDDDDDPRPGIVGSARGRAGRGRERTAGEEGKGEKGRAEGRGRKGKVGKVRGREVFPGPTI